MPFLNACVAKYTIKEKLPNYLEYDYTTEQFALYLCRLNINKTETLTYTVRMSDVYNKVFDRKITLKIK